MYNPYEKKGVWLKGNVHNHTTNSDGKYTPLELCQYYREKGYDFICFTDHDRMTPELNLDIVTISGVEFSDSRGHMSAFGIANPITTGTSISREQQLSEAHNQNGIVTMNHSNIDYPNLGWSLDELKRIGDFDGIEIYNYFIEIGWPPGYAVEMWESLLTYGLNGVKIGADNWTEVRGNWVVEGGEYSQDDESIIGRTIAGDTNWTDYTIELKAKILSGDSRQRAIRIIFRCIGDNNFYQFQLYEDEKKVKLWKYVDGNWVRLGEVNHRVDLDTWYHVKIDVYGSSIKCYVNDELKLEVNDSTHSQGNIRLETKYAHIHFDDIKVTTTQQLFSDRFISGDISDWTPVSGTWQLENDEYTVQASFLGRSFAGDSSWTDYILEGELFIERGNDAYLIVRARDQDNFYKIYISSSRNEVAIQRIDNARSFVPIQSSNINIRNRTWYKIKCICLGDRFYVYVNDELKIDGAVDNTILNGSIGVGSHNDYTRFKNIRVTSSSVLFEDNFDVKKEVKRYWGFAVDDFHRKSISLGGWIVVNAESKKKEAILKSIKDGDFYSSTGIVIKNVSLVGDIIHIWTENANEIKFISSGGHLEKTVYDRNATYKIRGDEDYVRIECVGGVGDFAWTNPIYVEGIKHPKLHLTPVLNIGHRGAKESAPENTIAAFEAAAELGANMIEFDIWQSRDGQLMVIHDLTVDRTTNGTGSVSNFTKNRLRGLDAGSWFSSEFSGEWIPTLEMALTWAKEKGMKVYLHVKDQNIEDKVVKAIKDSGMRGNVVVFETDQPNLHEKIKRIDKRILTTSHIWGEASGMQRFNGLVAKQFADVDVLFVQGLDPSQMQEVVTKAREFDLDCIGYANSPERMMELINLGMVGLLTDRPEILNDVIKEVEEGIPVKPISELLAADFGYNPHSILNIARDGLFDYYGVINVSETMNRILELRATMMEVNVKKDNRTIVVESFDGNPLLRDILGYAQGKIGVQIHVKSQGIEDELVAIIQDSGMVDNTLIFDSHGNVDNQKIKQLNSSVRTSIFIKDFQEFRNIRGFANADILQVYEPGVGISNMNEVINTAHDNGLKVIGLVIDDQATMEELMDLGIDGIMTNYPGKLREVLFK